MSFFLKSFNLFGKVLLLINLIPELTELFLSFLEFLHDGYFEFSIVWFL